MNPIITISMFGLQYLKNAFMYNKNMNISTEGREEVVARLKFIGHIEKDEKIDVKHINRQVDNIYTKISRTVLYPDNRNNCLKFIKEVVGRTFEFLEYDIIKGNIPAGKSLVSDLLKAKQGIVNIKHTYSGDTKFCCDMDVIIEGIVYKLEIYKDQYPDLFPVPSFLQPKGDEKIEKILKINEHTTTKK